MAKFSAAWAACENPPLDKVNPHFKSKFASLAATLAEVRKACVPHGLMYRQCEETGDFGTVIATYVTDGAEEMPLSRHAFEPPANPQEYGKALTYAKRQLAQMDWGIVGEEDDDAEGIVRPPQTPPKPRYQPPAPQVQPDGYGAAKNRCWRAMKARCAVLGGNPDERFTALTQEAGFVDTAEWWDMKAAELEAEA